MDDRERLEVLSTQKSFIVEAPAGSGKTELLALRYLNLLACVQKDPEEVVAVTFTRKAASEMKHRVLSALKMASQSKSLSLLENANPLQEMRLGLAQKVLHKDKENQWHLLENPNRLRILTLDSLAMMLAFRTPILSHFGGKPDVHDYPKALYYAAVKQFIQETTIKESWYEAFQSLFLYFENIDKIAQWMINLLGCRDQWLPYLYRLKEHSDFRQSIEHSIDLILEDAIQKLITILQNYESEIIELVDHVASNFAEMGMVHPFQRNHKGQSLPQQADSIPFWIALVDLFLTQTGDWRKTVNKNQGFLSPSDTRVLEEKNKRKHFKAQCLSLIEQLSQIEGLNNLLYQLKNLPSSELVEEEYHIITSLQVILPILVGYLNLIFKETGKVDFIEISLGALYALRDEQGPTQVAQILDYKISHILVDEFQDTSAVQFELLENLIAEWSPNDGKTVFLVGDPQQSIYRFRGAEVGVFLHAQAHGIANMPLTNIHLKRNFRTQPEVLDWVSKTICNVFPGKNDLSTGAVAYKPSFSANQSQNEAGVYVKCFAQSKLQARFVVEEISVLQKNSPEKTIAILVRARTQLIELLGLLKAYTIPFYAKEIKQLSKMPHVLDLISLIKATNRWDDRIAWLSVLRAPWIGLSLNDIYRLTESQEEKTLWETIKNYDFIPELSQDAKDRLKPFVLILNYWNHQRYRKPLVQWIKGLWLKLGGKHCYPNSVMDDLDQIFKILASFVDVFGNVDLLSFEEKLLSVYTDQMYQPSETYFKQSDDRHYQLQLMTIHQAKGLEFDYVFLPNLERVSQKNDAPLLNWHDNWYGDTKLFLMGAKTNHNNNKNSIYYYLTKVIQQKQSYELIRLLYVAMTRAKSKLYLCFSSEKNENNEWEKPKSGSFLSLLWEHIDIPDSENIVLKNHSDSKPPQDIPFVYRTYEPIKLNTSEYGLNNINLQKDDLNRPELTDNHFRVAGTLFHRLIAYYCQYQHLLTINQQMLIERIPFLLGRFGFSKRHFEQALIMIQKAIENIFCDPKGQWILNKTHTCRIHEKGFTYIPAKGAHAVAKRIIIDCAFVDEKNQLWVIDFKLTQSTFISQIELNSEIEQYQKQLYRYQQVMEHQMNRSVRAALYFPSIPHWYESSASQKNIASKMDD